MDSTHSMSWKSLKHSNSKLDYLDFGVYTAIQSIQILLSIHIWIKHGKEQTNKVRFPFWQNNFTCWSSSIITVFLTHSVFRSSCHQYQISLQNLGSDSTHTKSANLLIVLKKTYDREPHVIIYKCTLCKSVKSGSIASACAFVIASAAYATQSHSCNSDPLYMCYFVTWRVFNFSTDQHILWISWMISSQGV